MNELTLWMTGLIDNECQTDTVGNYRWEDRWKKTWRSKSFRKPYSTGIQSPFKMVAETFKNVHYIVEGAY